MFAHESDFGGVIMFKKISKKLLIILLVLCVLISNTYANIPGQDPNECSSCEQQADRYTGSCAGGPDIPVESCIYYDYPHHHFRMYGASWLECRHCGNRETSAKITTYGPVLCRIEHSEDYYPHLGANAAIGKKYPVSYFRK